MLQLLIASTNRHKIEEFQNMIPDIREKIKILSPSDLPSFPEIEENGTTFEVNSGIKAKESSRYADMAAMADDSGLEVDALNGEPGVHSARYAGVDATDGDRIAKLLKNMEGQTNRKARFVCVISMAYRGNVVAQFRGECEGTIALAAAGTSGFGYDPVFIPDGYDKSFAELGEEVKNKISHRAKAFAQAADFIRSELTIMDDFEFE